MDTLHDTSEEWAVACYEVAAERTRSIQERDYLIAQIVRIGPPEV